MRFGLIYWILPFVILISILTLFFFAQRFWFRQAFSLLERLPSRTWQKIGRAAVTVIFASFVVLLADRIFLHLLPSQGPASLFIQVTQLWLFASSLAFLAMKVVYGVEWLWSGATRASSSSPVDGERRSFFKYAAYGAGAIPLLAGIYGYTAERFDFTVHSVEVPIPNLPANLDGFRIVQLSDIHIGDFMPAHEVRRAVEIANGLNAHLAVLTGDLLTSKRDPLYVCVAELSRLNAPLGIWGCNGNHEIYADAEDEAERLYQRFGMTLLRQRSAQVEWNGARLNLIGVDYQRQPRSFPASSRPMLEGVEGLVRNDMPNVLLSHNPNSFHRAAELGIELSLAGHTHGGQVKIEIIDHSFSPASFVTDFIAGLYRLPASGREGAGFAHLYVNRGLGTIGVPARIGVDPEITLLTLRRA